MRVSKGIITRLTTRSIARDVPSSSTFYLGCRESCAELRRLQPTRFSTEGVRGPVRPVVPPHWDQKAIAHSSELVVSSRSHLPVRVVCRRERRTRPGQPRPIRSDGLERCAKLSRTPWHASRSAALHGCALLRSYSDQLARPDLVAFQRPAQVPLVPLFQGPTVYLFSGFF